MIPAELLSAAAAGAIALVALLIAWKIRPEPRFGRYRNLVIVIDDKALNARKS